MDKNERINNEQGMSVEANKDHSADADRVKEVYKVTIAGSIINVVPVSYTHLTLPTT